MTCGDRIGAVAQYCGQVLPVPSGHSPWRVKPKRLAPPHWNASRALSRRVRQYSGL